MLNELRRANSHAAQDQIRPIELKCELIDREGVEASRDTDEVPAIVRTVKVAIGSVDDPVSAVSQQRHGVAVIDAPHSCGCVMTGADNVLLVGREREAIDE